MAEDSEFVPSPDGIKEILKSTQVVAMVGISDDNTKPSHKVGKFLKSKGYKVIPVNPKHDTIIGEKAYKSLLDIPDKIDVVDIFRKPEAVDEIVDEAIKKGVKVVWMQESVINEEAARKAKDAGIKVVMDRCMYRNTKNILCNHELNL